MNNYELIFEEESKRKIRFLDDDSQEKSLKIGISISFGTVEQTNKEISTVDEYVNVIGAGKILDRSPRSVAVYRRKFNIPTVFKNERHHYKVSDLEKFKENRLCFVKKEDTKTDREN